MTDRDRPAHVLMTWDHYRRLTGNVVTPMHLIGDDATAEVVLPLPDRQPPAAAPI